MSDTCGVCNRPLLDAESRAAGIGPTCAKKFHSGPRTAGSHQLTFEEHDMTDPKPTGRCGNDPRTVLSPGDQAAVAQFTAYLTRRRRAFPAVEEPETEEQRADREETERAHEAGDHEYCGPTCEVEFPSDLLRNTILYAALPGSARMLDELLRRADVEAKQEAERFKADYLAACKTIAEMHEAATGRTGMGPIRGVVEDIADMRTRADDAEKERYGLSRALHLLRSGMTRVKGNDFAAEYVVSLIDETVAQCTGTVMEPCDSDEQHARAVQAEAAIKRTVAAMRAFTVASGSAGVDPHQVIGLLSLPRPDRDHEAPAPPPPA
ncbi:DUF6011 domain-containing protein [Streptomyces sp. NPDC060198]|uniref:DUF6011 domain-containing protein n=1 Tax=Streptomyces sp. NPDC060198 TaxID=3347070 RepID=UPI00364ED016